MTQNLDSFSTTENIRDVTDVTAWRYWQHACDVTDVTKWCRDEIWYNSYTHFTVWIYHFQDVTRCIQVGKNQDSVEEEITRKEKCLCWTLSLFLDANIRHCKRFYLLSFHFKLTSYNWILLFQLHRRETFYFSLRDVFKRNVNHHYTRDVSNVTKMCHGSSKYASFKIIFT